ncbi:MAG: PorP/SprF family type IX secretion system membrane protein [Bacteroidales bacterium]|nr:PorP/SprF family type IX secretion system membrane protein [Bacteroidales bacterium]
MVLMVRNSYINILHRLISVYVLVIFPVQVVNGQDIHFSMFNACPLYLNPAEAGNFNGDWRIAGNYRNQWSSLAVPFHTAAIAFEKKFFLLHQDFSAGAVFINDESGAVALSVNKLYGSLGFRKSINRNIFHVGLQLGYVFKSLNLDKVTLPGQFNRDLGIFDAQRPSGEANMGERTSNLDLNAGVMWKRKIKRFEPEIGLSLSHLNYPNESFYDDNQKLPIRSTVHATLKANLGEAVYLQPALLYMNHKGSNETIAGFNAGFNVFGRKSAVKELMAGVYLRNGFLSNSDAIAVLAGATIGRIDFAFCYDITISGLKTANNQNGAFEISLQYRSISTVLNSYSIPCERF